MTTQLNKCAAPAVARILIRVIGALVGLLGGFTIIFGSLVLYQTIADQEFGVAFFTAFFLAVGVYGVYVAYLVWLRFSPLAVRHICGVAGFYLLGLLIDLLHLTRTPHRTWMSLAFLGCLIVVYFAYKLASRRLSRWLFPESVAAIQSIESGGP